MVKKVEDCETFDDVISVCREIYAHSQKEKHVDAPANPTLALLKALQNNRFSRIEAKQ